MKPDAGIVGHCDDFYTVERQSPSKLVDHYYSLEMLELHLNLFC